MSNTFPCVDFDIDANKYRVDTGHAFVGGFDTYEEAQAHCIRIAFDKARHDQEQLYKDIVELMDFHKVQLVTPLVMDIVNKVNEGWRAQ